LENRFSTWLSQEPDALETAQSTLSTHLTLLRDAGLVRTRKEGRWIYYGLSADVAPLTESFFQHFADAIHDKRIRRDAERVHRRLQLREDGCCTLGFNQLDSKRGGGGARASTEPYSMILRTVPAAESEPAAFHRDDFVLLIDDMKVWVVRMSDIPVLEACENCTRVHFADGTAFIRRLPPLLREQVGQLHLLSRLACTVSSTSAT
jgi:DNA-binding transcriptional ArsR family regulator